MNIFTRFITAIARPQDYDKLVKQKPIKVIMYFCTLTTLFVASIYFNIAREVNDKGGVNKILNDNIPEFTLTNGELQFDKQIDYSDSVQSIRVYSDTSVDSIDKDKVNSNYIRGFYLSSKNIDLYIRGTRQSEISYSTLFPDDTNKEQFVAKCRNILLIAFAIAFIFTLLYVGITNLITVLLYALIGKFFFTKGNSKIKYTQIMAVCVYAQTLPIVIKSINQLFNEFIPNTVLGFVTFAVTIGYFIAGMQVLRQSSSNVA